MENAEKELAFEKSEYLERLDKVRKRMVDKEIEVLISHTPENICYLTGYYTPGYYKYQCCIVPLDRDPIMLVRGFEKMNVYHLSWVDEAFGYDDTEDHVELTKQILVDKGYANAHIGVEKDSWFFTIQDFEKLISSMPDATFVDGSMTIEPVRLVKSPAEIEMIKRAARAVEAAMQAGIDAIEVGSNEDIVAGEIWKALVSNGSTWPGLAPFVSVGTHTAWPHATWAGRRIEKRDVFAFELGGCVKRYSAAMFRCGVVEEPTQQVASMAEACAYALDETIKAMKVGAISHDINEVCKQALEDAGWGGIHEHRAGYSIGIAFPPDWGEGHIMSLQAHDPRPLEAGMVFHVIPTLLIEGVAGIACTDTVLVTETGGVPLTNFDRKLHIVEG